MSRHPKDNGSRKRRRGEEEEDDAEGFEWLTRMCQVKKPRRGGDMLEPRDQSQIEQGKKASIKDLAGSIVIPSSLLEAELQQDVSDAAPFRGYVDQDSEDPLPYTTSDYEDFLENSDDNGFEDDESDDKVSDNDDDDGDDDDGDDDDGDDEEEEINPLIRALVSSDDTNINIDQDSVQEEYAKADQFLEEILTRRSKTYRASSAHSPILTSQPQADPKGYPAMDHDPDKPFRLLDCEDEVRHRILEHILTEPKPIVPYYNEGNVQDTSAGPPHPNFPIPMLLALAGRANRQYYEEARAIFYGWNRWKLIDPRVSIWWLKHIGDNIEHLSDIGIVLSQGMTRDAGQNLTWAESLWFELFFWLKKQHNLSRIFVTFEYWDDSPITGVPLDEHPLISDARIAVVETLLNFRGLDQATIIPGPHVDQQDTDLIQFAMTLDVGQHDDDVEDRQRQLMLSPTTWPRCIGRA